MKIWRMLPREAWRDCGYALALLLVALFIYSPTFDGYEFLLWDDLGYVVTNPLTRSGLSAASVLAAFSDIHVWNYHPLTMVSFLLDHQLWGLNPDGYHLVNAVLNSLNVVLIFVLFRLTTGNRGCAFFLALLFAAHPTHVESVAWISQRKDVLFLFFWLLSAIAYSRWVKQKTPLLFVGCSLLYTASLLSKSTAVTFPLAMLLFDIWPLRRYSAAASGREWLARVVEMVLEKVPWLLLSAYFSSMTVLAQKGEMYSMVDFTVTERLCNAGISYCEYIFHTLWPNRLTIFYPLPEQISILSGALCIGLLLIVSLISIVCVKKYPYLFCGWFFFLGTLVPNIGIVQVGSQSMADRYLYLPGLGLLWIFVWGLAEIARKLNLSRRVVCGVGAVCVLLLVSQVFAYLPYWRNTVEITMRTLALTKSNYAAHRAMAIYSHYVGDHRQEAFHYKKYLEIVPDDYLIWGNLARAVRAYGDYAAAENFFLVAIRLYPTYPEGWAGLVETYVAGGKRAEALKALAEFAKLAPEDPRIEDLKAKLRTVE